MQPTAEIRLGIDYGSINTVAVLAWPDEHWTPLLFDGAPQLPSAVFIDGDGEPLTGAAAWQRATTGPDGFVMAPLVRMGDGRIMVGSGQVEAVDLVAATLRRVGAEAARVAGGPVGDVRLVVPAGWGPRRRTLMRQAAHRAGLGQPTLVEAPVAAAERMLASGTQIMVGSFLAVCDIGSGCEVTVLWRASTGFEVLATMRADDAGGAQLDQALVDRMIALAGAGDAGPLSDGDRLTLLANVRTAKAALAHSASVAVALPPPRPAVVLDNAQLAEVSHPVAVRAAQTLRQVVDAAEIDAGRLAAVFCVGAAATGLARLIGDETGLAPVVVDEPQLAAALGAAGAGARAVTAGAVGAEPVPPLRRAIASLIPGLASLALAVHFVISADLERTRSRGFYDPSAYLLANWGELAMGALFALVACLAAATVLAATLPRQATGGQPSAASTHGNDQTATGLLAAVALGLTIGALYAVGASVYFDLPTGAFLRWALLPILPIAVAATVTAALAARWAKTPTSGWHGWLNFPPSSVVCAAAGMVLVQVSMTARAYPSQALLNGLVGRSGALLLGVGATLAVVESPRFRIILAAPLAVFAAAIVSWPTTGMLGVGYVAAATLWWVQRVWQLTRERGRTAPPAGPLSAS